MTTEFYKYHGTGNDFIIIDNRDKKVKLTEKDISLMCHRRFGIGADGLMLLEKSKNYDFEMKYYNSDGKEGTMCGNGGRCITAFAYSLKIIGEKTMFMAIDGAHEAIIDSKQNISLKMKDISINSILHTKSYSVIDTGSPHYVAFFKDVDNIDVFGKGKKIRYNDTFSPGGLNVNFVEILGSDKIKVRTYERGVEDETLSCGTGVTASAIICRLKKKMPEKIDIVTKGGNLRVQFEIQKKNITNVWLTGPATLVFKGIFEP